MRVELPGRPPHVVRRLTSAFKLIDTALHFQIPLQADPLWLQRTGSALIEQCSSALTTHVEELVRSLVAKNPYLLFRLARSNPTPLTGGNKDCTANIRHHFVADSYVACFLGLHVRTGCVGVEILDAQV
jgi:hypothetical protein